MKQPVQLTITPNESQQRSSHRTISQTAPAAKPKIVQQQNLHNGTPLRRYRSLRHRTKIYRPNANTVITEKLLFPSVWSEEIRRLEGELTALCKLHLGLCTSSVRVCV